MNKLKTTCNQLLRSSFVALSIALLPAMAEAQNSSLLGAATHGMPGRPLTIESVSMIYTPPEPIKTLQLHDIVTVVVNVNSRMQSDGDVENRKRTNIDAILYDWIMLDKFSIKAAPQEGGDPRAKAKLDSQFRAEADMSSRSSLVYTIAAEVVDVRPNGTLVIEARQQVTINDELWERALLGTIRREDVTPDNKVQSEDIANLRVFNRESGQVRDGYKRGWFQRFYDRVQPF